MAGERLRTSALATGTRLGPYEILERIGAGGMGAVYRANDTRLRRAVAIKVGHEGFSDRFRREALAIAALNHAHIATLFDVGPDYLVMEFVDGPTLAERIQTGPLPLAEALRIAREIADALEAAHEKGIVHRDLKPANVKLTAAGNVKVLDFGLAKATTRADASSEQTQTVDFALTRQGEVAGTPAYMSPEQTRGEPVDKRTDIWAFGVLLYEMVTGSRPFGGQTTSDVIAAVLTQEPDWTVVPPEVRPLVRRCLERDPKQRLRDIGDAWLLLDTPPNAAPTRARRLLWVVAAAMAATAIVVSVLWRNTSGPNPAPVVRLDVDFAPGILPAVIWGPSAVLSPDGTRIVYVARDRDGTRLFTRKLAEEHATPLQGTLGAMAPFFSPDAQSVGFFADGKLKTISLRGGSSVTLASAPNPRGGSWGKDGNIYAALNYTSPIVRISIVDGGVGPVTTLSKERREITHRFPQLIAGAQAILFTAHTAIGNFDEATIEIQSLSDGNRKTLARGAHFARYAATGHLLFVRDRTLYAAPLDTRRMEVTAPEAPVVENVWRRPSSGGAFIDLTESGTLLYAKERPPSQTLEWLDTTGRTQPLRPTASSYNFTIRVSPDGTRLAIATNERGNLDVWAYDWARDAMSRLTFGPSVESYPVWSPDGKHLAFASTSNSDGVSGISWTRADGSGAEVRLLRGSNPRPYSFTPSGDRLALQEWNAETGEDIWIMPMGDAGADNPKGGTPEVYIRTRFNESAPMFSPDGRWLAYQSDESGANEVYVRRFPTGGKWQVSSGGGASPVWSKKRPELFFRTDEGIMMAAYRANDDLFEFSRPRLWVERKGLGSFFDVAPTGDRIAIVQDEAASPHASTHVTLIQNFFDEVRSRSPVR